MIRNKKIFLLLTFISITIFSNSAYKTESSNDQKYDFTLKDQNNRLFRLSSHKGKYIHLDFSAVWCSPCRIQAKYMHEVEEDFKNKNFISVTLLLRANLESQKLWAKQYQVKHVLSDTNHEVARLFKAYGVPVNIILNPDLTIAGRWVGSYRKKIDFKRKLKNIIPNLFNKSNVQISSKKASIVLYSKINFKGSKFTIDKSISSIKEKFQSIFLPKGISVILFNSKNFNGQSEILSTSDKNLNDNNIKSSQISSLYIIQ